MQNIKNNFGIDEDEVIKITIDLGKDKPSEVIEVQKN